MLGISGAVHVLLLVVIERAQKPFLSEYFIEYREKQESCLIYALELRVARENLPYLVCPSRKRY